jgi:hypothetical protein
MIQGSAVNFSRHHIFDRLDIIVDISGRAALEEWRKHGDADEAAMIDDEFQLFVALVTRMRLQTGRQAVGISDWLFGGENDVFTRFGADCQRRRDFAAAGRSKSTARTQSRRPPTAGAFLLVAFHS